MIKGHGDDAYLYPYITSDFSSNICPRSHEALTRHLAALPQLLSHYPEPEPWSLEALIARRHAIDPRTVIVTAGATDAIYLVAQTFRYRHRIDAPTFSEYDDACRMFPTTDGSRTCFWLCNPNNPTGTVLDSVDVREIIRRHDLTVIDQSYEHYTHERLMPPHIALCYGCVIQIHSMTKTYAVPGLRLGYIVAPVRMADAIRRNMRPWATSTVAVEAGRFLLQHDELMATPDLDEAQRLLSLLRGIDGISVADTATNFMLCHIANHSAAELKDYLARRHAMLIRDASNFPSLTTHHFRVAAQSPQEDDALVAAIQDFIHAYPAHR